MIKFNLIKELCINDTDMIYDSFVHLTKNNILAFSTIEGNIQLIDMNAENNYLVSNYKRHHKGSAVRCVRFARNHSHLLVSAAKTIKLTDVNTGQVIRKISNDGIKIYSLLIIDDYLLCIGDDDGSFKVFDYRVDRGVSANLKQCETYISDLDIDSRKRIVVASSGEGTLTAFNIRANRMVEPQSELFDAGFQCVRYLESKSKVVVGAEDGAINIFNVNEWGNISDRFPIRGNTTRAQGFCSIDHIEPIQQDVIVVGSSDGKLRAINILPNQILCDVYKHASGVESLSVCSQTNKVISTNDNIIKIFNYHDVNKTKNKSHSSNFFEDLCNKS